MWNPVCVTDVLPALVSIIGAVTETELLCRINTLLQNFKIAYDLLGVF
jgi:hypothetical protein